MPALLHTANAGCLAGLLKGSWCRADGRRRRARAAAADRDDLFGRPRPLRARDRVRLGVCLARLRVVKSALFDAFPNNIPDPPFIVFSSTAVNADGGAGDYVLGMKTTGDDIVEIPLQNSFAFPLIMVMGGAPLLIMALILLGCCITCVRRARHLEEDTDSSSDEEERRRKKSDKKRKTGGGRRKRRAKDEKSKTRKKKKGDDSDDDDDDDDDEDEEAGASKSSRRGSRRGRRQGEVEARAGEVPAAPAEPAEAAFHRAAADRFGGRRLPATTTAPITARQRHRRRRGAGAAGAAAAAGLPAPPGPPGLPPGQTPEDAGADGAAAAAGRAHRRDRPQHRRPRRPTSGTLDTASAQGPCTADTMGAPRRRLDPPGDVRRNEAVPAWCSTRRARWRAAARCRPACARSRSDQWVDGWGGERGNPIK